MHVSMKVFILDSESPLGRGTTMDPSSVPANSVDGGKHHWLWPPVIRKVRTFPTFGGGASGSRARKVLSICDTPVVFSDIVDEGVNLVDEEQTEPSELDEALEELAAYVEHSAPPKNLEKDHNNNDSDSDEAPFAKPAAPGGPLFKPKAPKKFAGKGHSMQCCVFEFGSITFFPHDSRFECICYKHHSCILTRNAKKLPVAFMHWWLKTGGESAECETKPSHWTDEYMLPSDETIDAWCAEQDARADPMYVALRDIEKQVVNYIPLEGTAA